MRTLGVDARRTDPHPSVDELHPAEGASPLRPRETSGSAAVTQDPSVCCAAALDELLPQADFVLLTIPHTPETEGLFDASKFALMKSSAVFCNVGRVRSAHKQPLPFAAAR